MILDKPRELLDLNGVTTTRTCYARVGEFGLSRTPATAVGNVYHVSVTAPVDVDPAEGDSLASGPSSTRSAAPFPVQPSSASWVIRANPIIQAQFFLVPIEATLGVVRATPDPTERGAGSAESTVVSRRQVGGEAGVYSFGRCGGSWVADPGTVGLRLIGRVRRGGCVPLLLFLPQLSHWVG